MKQSLLLLISLLSLILLITCHTKKSEPKPSSSLPSSAVTFQGTSYNFITSSVSSGNDFELSGISNKFATSSIIVLFPNGKPAAGSYLINSTNSKDVSIQFTDSTGVQWFADSNSVKLNVSISSNADVFVSFSNVIFTQFQHDSITTIASGVVSE
jgi:hypothetical protein